MPSSRRRGDEVGPLAFLVPLEVEIGGQSIALGDMRYTVTSARVARRPGEGGEDYVVVPTGDPVATVTLHSPVPAPEQPYRTGRQVKATVVGSEGMSPAMVSQKSR